MLFNKVTIKGAKQAVQMFGPAQHAVGKAVADSVAEGVIPESEADDLFICVGVFIHWEAADDKKIQEYNYKATKESIARAVNGEPKPSEVVAKRNSAKHPCPNKPKGPGGEVLPLGGLRRSPHRRKSGVEVFGVPRH